MPTVGLNKIDFQRGGEGKGKGGRERERGERNIFKTEEQREREGYFIMNGKRPLQ